ncbi:MAG: hypothetical protein AB7I18_12825 [Candidatus Berkiella sp.]
MTKLQLHLFAFTAAWVLAEAVSPSISYEGKLQAASIAVFATAMANGVYRDFIRMLYSWRK